MAGSAAVGPAPSYQAGRAPGTRTDRGRDRGRAPALAPAAALALVLVLAAIPPARAEAPKVVASIAPVHALVAAVMAGTGAPRLLLPRGASPHGYALKPSDARALSEAALVVWVGPALERFLARPLATLAAGAERLTLAAAPGVRTLPARGGGLWDGGDGHGHENGHEHGHGEHGGAADEAQRIDPHLWLDPSNAAAIGDAAAAALARLDPEGAARYRANAARLRARIDALDRRLAERLAPVRARPYIVLHDAYQYFERHYRLNAVGAIAVGPDRPPGARRLVEIRARLRATGAVCVFAEPQFAPKVVRVVIEDTGARRGVLDPLGAAIPPGPEAWFRLMADLAGNLAGCLAGG